MTYKKKRREYLATSRDSWMGKGPGLYSDIGKKARDLLSKDYQSDYKLTITSVATSRVYSCSGHRARLCFTTDVNVGNNSNLLTAITVDKFAPGLKAIFSFEVPNQRSDKIELQYLHKYAGISTSIGLSTNPIVNFSGLFGNNTIALGTDLAIDSATGNITKGNLGLNYTNGDLMLSLNVNDKGGTLNASHYYILNPRTHTAVGAELNHIISTKETTFHIGSQHALDPLTLVKTRVNNYGKASVLIQHEWRPKSLVTISGEVDTRAIEQSAKFGLALALALKL